MQPKQQRSTCQLMIALTLCGLLAGCAANPSSPASTSEATASPRLIGVAVLDADTFRPGVTSGHWVEPMNQRTPPFTDQQPIQGISAIIHDGDPDDGVYLAMSDNGYGTRENSADYVLCVYRVQPDFVSGNVKVETVFELRDPRKLIPFPITADRSLVTFEGQTHPVDPVVRQQRLLTGADFDLESFRQLPDGTFVFGDEFGPFLLHTNARGELIAPPIALPGRWSPQNPVKPADQQANVATSGGFEGMALSADAKTLYPMLEKPRPDNPAATDLEIFAFDVATLSYRSDQPIYRYPLDPQATAIGDFTAIDEHRYLVIERDSQEGPKAAIKRVYLVDTRDVAPGEVLRKHLVIDLMRIPDPDAISDLSVNNIFTMPFLTIESVLPLDPQQLLIVNDNNYPFSVGRHAGTTGEPDDTEFVLIRLSRDLRLTNHSQLD